MSTCISFLLKELSKKIGGSLCHTAFTGLQTWILPPKKKINTEQYKKKLPTRYHNVLPPDLQGTEEQSSTTLPIDFHNK